MDHGLDPRVSYGAVIEHARRALETDSRSFEALNNLGLSYVKIGSFNLEHGLEPTESFHHANEAFAQVVKLTPTRKFGYANLCEVNLDLATYLGRIGQDPRPTLQKGIDGCLKALQLDPSHAISYSNLGLLCFTLGDWQLDHQIDPREALLSGRTASSIDHYPLTYRDLANLEVLSARWSVVRGRDPSPSLSAATRAANQALTLLDGKSPDVWLTQAEIETVRAQCLKKRHQPIEAAVRAGLDLARRSRSGNPSEALTFAFEGKLHLLSAQVARTAAARVAAAEQARVAFEHALTINRILEHDFGPQLAEARALGQSP